MKINFKFTSRRRWHPRACTTEQVFQAHVSAVEGGDVQQVMADYADDALLMTVGGGLCGEGCNPELLREQVQQSPDQNGFHNWWEPLGVGPNGAHFASAYGGIISLRDTR